MIVRATRDFFVGGEQVPVIRKGDTREVSVDADGRFCTKTNKGHFFGQCHIDRWWEIVETPTEEPVDETRLGYVLATRLLQSGIMLDDEEIAACDYFLKVGREV